MVINFENTFLEYKLDEIQRNHDRGIISEFFLFLNMF